MRREIEIVDARDERAVDALLTRRSAAGGSAERRVRAIVDAVRRDGDTALVRFARRFDGMHAPLEVEPAEIRRQAAEAPADVRSAIRRAARHIDRVASRQLPRRWRMSVVRGVEIEQRVEPLQRVGCYVPGGRFPLPSSLLMTAIPARAAGVREIVAVCPRPDPAVMAAALEAGVTRLFRVGGAHAIAALAYGTETVPRVDKIVGPGNRYVALAKALVSADCSIDFFAGPTEIVIVSASGRAAWIAADLAAQAEHDPDARAIFITWRRPLAREVAESVVAIPNARVIVTRNEREAIALANRIAPEHLVVDGDALGGRALTAGAVFVGRYAAPAAGDYATGSNHVLPTGGAARFRGGLSAADFVRVMSVQRLTRDGLARLAPTILPLARAEGLRAHAASVEIRLRETRPRGVRV